ncbi:hypothetical protein CSA37_01005 [Candidatus Fermentibacteria bacterium]|nr:MAG: hypothetical protein CSA37_01005 [Candidatus Fermentibacteria bacterium]
MRIYAVMIMLISAAAASADIVDQAMVKIYTNSASYNYYIPWSTDAPMETSGSGCVVEGDLILTNAHVVSDQTFIQVRREGDPRKYQAFVVAVSHDADLALITVYEPSFFEGIRPLQLGDLPKARDEVTVYGYPMGGDALSTTKGVVSRIESSRYAHSGLSLLTVQIDAAINPGNSGGPAIIDNRIIGVTMQTMTSADGIGYVIPVPVIEHFFEDMEDGKYNGFPSAGFSYQTIRNDAFSHRYGIPDEQTGVMVSSLAWDSPASASLQIGDVVMAIDGKAIAGDGTVELRDGSRTRLDYMINRHQLDESISMDVIRNGDPITVNLTLDATIHDLTVVSAKIYDRPAEYLIYGGAVFMPLSLNYLESWGGDWYLNAVDYLSYPLLFDNWRTEDRNEIVVLTFMLPAEVNTGYETLQNEIIETVDGVTVSDFNHFARLIDSGEGEFLVLKTNLDNVIVLDRSLSEEMNPEIMERYGIARNRVIL